MQCWNNWQKKAKMMATVSLKRDKTLQLHQNHPIRNWNLAITKQILRSKQTSAININKISRINTDFIRIGNLILENQLHSNWPKRVIQIGLNPTNQSFWDTIIYKIKMINERAITPILIARTSNENHHPITLMIIHSSFWVGRPSKRFSSAHHLLTTYLIFLTFRSV